MGDNDSGEARLLCTLGTSQAVVIEAHMLLRARGLTLQTHVFTTANVQVNQLLEYFDDLGDGSRFTVTRAAGLDTLNTGDNHAAFEELMWRWYIGHCAKGLSDGTGLPYVCLAGGFKTMSASLQQAAFLFGAREVFHVLTGEPHPKTLEEIRRALKEGRVDHVDLGSSGGWPQFAQLSKSLWALELEEVSGCRGEFLARCDAAGGGKLRDRVRQYFNNVSEHAAAPESASFPAVLLASQDMQNWLKEALCPDDPADRKFVADMPKVELHCHLGGFAVAGELLKAVRGACADKPEGGLWPPEPEFPAGWPEPESPVSLECYRGLGDATGSQLLHDSGALQRQISLLYAHFQEERVLYAEVRCSPNNYARKGEAAWDVLTRIQEAFEAEMRASRESGKWPCQVNLIIIVTRLRDGDLSAIPRHLALAITASQRPYVSGQCNVVGVDLAGQEGSDTRAEFYQSAFEGALRCGLAVTAHAGENDNVEGIWQAVHHLSARRLGHGLRLADSPALLRTVADRGICVELCPYANYQIVGFQPMEGKPEYPLRKYLEHGVRATVNTDNIGISQAGLGQNLLFTARLNPGIRRADLLTLQHNALESAFIPARERASLRAAFSEHLLELTCR